MPRRLIRESGLSLQVLPHALATPYFKREAKPSLRANSFHAWEAHGGIKFILQLMPHTVAAFFFYFKNTGSRHSQWVLIFTESRKESTRKSTGPSPQVECARCSCECVPSSSLADSAVRHRLCCLLGRTARRSAQISAKSLPSPELFLSIKTMYAIAEP